MSDNAADEPGPVEGRLRLYAFGLLAVGTILTITVIRSGGGSDDDSGPADPSGANSESCNAAAAGLLVALDQGQAEDLEADDFGERWAGIAGSECLRPSDAIIVVHGLPDVSGVYRTGEGNVALTGFVGSRFEHGTCFVGGDDEAFQTKATHVIDIGDATPIHETTTIDVGRTQGGSNFLAVVRERPDEITHNYEAAVYRANAEIELTTFEGEERSSNEWAGVVLARSTSYNNRDFFPFTEAQWEGDPTHVVSILVFCG